jgi:hypothetical protein
MWCISETGAASTSAGKEASDGLGISPRVHIAKPFEKGFEVKQQARVTIETMLRVTRDRDHERRLLAYGVETYQRLARRFVVAGICGQPNIMRQAQLGEVERRLAHGC